MSEWQPIETAPLGTDVLCYCEQTTVLCIAWRDVTDSWWRNNAATRPTRKPTHWMPLPKAP